jgi:hypothetical protein
MWSRHFTGLPAIAAACALAVASCAKSDPTAGNPLPIIVPADTLICNVLEQQVPCDAIPTHLAKTLQTPTSKLIILSDRKAGRTDDAVTKLADELRKAGYSKVMVVGVITERP